MQKLVDLLNAKEIRYADELFYAEGEFFAIHDGKIAKLYDFLGDFEGIYKLLPSTERFIGAYIVANNLRYHSARIRLLAERNKYGNLFKFEVDLSSTIL